MIVCEFCREYEADGNACRLGLKIPKAMGCRDFDPAMKQFCANPNDFVSPEQIMQMATYFGFKGRELRKVGLMAAREVESRLEIPNAAPRLDA